MLVDTLGRVNVLLSRHWWNSKLRSALAANRLDNVARFLPNFPDMKTSIPSVLITFVLVCFGLVQNTQAVNPPPDGGYPGGNTAEGTDALFSLTSGAWNAALGTQALNHNTTGGGNTATGFQALLNNTTGNHNTAYGAQALFSNGSNRPGSSDNTATGYRALYLNADGEKNTANGAYALNSNTEGDGNTATGYGALANNQLGNANTATGYQALNSNTFEAGANTAIGYQALFKNTDASGNTATGYQALFNNTTGFSNIAYGGMALNNNTIGEDNTAVGHNVLSSNTTGNDNIALGESAGKNLTTGDSNIDIGNQGFAGEANTMRIGSSLQTRAFISGISGVAVTGSTVVVNANGQLGVAPSSVRFKDNIKPMNKTSEAILLLKPVIFRYKKELDPSGVSQFGLVAEDVEKINPALVVHDREGKPYTVRYDAVNAMLLNEFLKEHCKNEEQEKTIAELKSGMTALAATVKEQASQIQKVTAQLEASNPAPQVVNNP